MEWYFIVLIVIAILILLLFITMRICYNICFYINRKKDLPPDDFDSLPGDIYKPYKEKMIKWMEETKALDSKEYTITSFDGLKLYGKYYHLENSDTIEIMFHGYRGSAERDLCGGSQRAFAVGHSAFVVNQRGSGQSEGNFQTFGVNEHKDCLLWINKVIEEFGSDIKIVLAGVSMGAATAIMASSSENLPKNVIGVIADCSYSSQKEVIIKTIKEMKLPPKIFYPILKLSAKIFGKFNLEELTPLEAIKKSKVPTIILQGDKDDIVPPYMAQELYEANPKNNKLVIFEGAGHCACVLKDSKLYINSLNEFFKK